MHELVDPLLRDTVKFVDEFEQTGVEGGGGIARPVAAALVSQKAKRNEAVDVLIDAPMRAHARLLSDVALRPTVGARFGPQDETESKPARSRAE